MAPLPGCREVSKQYLKSLQRPDGTVSTQPSEIEDIAYHFYQQLFTYDLHASADEISHFLQVVRRKISSHQNKRLLAPYTEDEVTRALFQMHPSKAPGLDGFSTAHNTSVITLIPKQKGASKITEYRPISLIGALEKVISKTIANRIQTILDEVISSEQCAFIKNRLISDNLIIAQEISHYISKVRGPNIVFAALKLDMEKAYDGVECPFLELLLKRFGFASLWVERIMQYVKSASYFIRINGHLSEPIKPSRGLRQGDPLSPYLFIICVEWQSYMLKHYDHCGLIEGSKINRRAPSISHLLFADDSLLFMKVNTSTIRALRDVLTTYRRISGQSINLLKSEMVLSRNVTSSLLKEVHDVLGVKIVPTLNKYLGLPVQMSRKKMGIGILSSSFFSSYFLINQS
ncbi:hypothetical protein QQ045_028870 [Rhodiola kirilowii]